MALLFCDGFDHYATADILEKWTNKIGSGAYEIGAYGRNSTNGLKFPTSWYAEGIYAAVLGGVNEVIVGVAVKPIAFTASQAFLTFGSGSNWECGVAILSDLTLQPFVVNYAAGFVPGDTAYFTLLGSASSSGLQIGVWAYVEVRMKCDGSVGTCTIRINGIEVATATGLDTLYTSNVLTKVCFAGKADNLGQYYIDDVVIMDTSGSVNNDFLGDVTVDTKYPTANGTTIDGTPSTGDNYACVDETPASETDYVTLADTGDLDTYVVGDVATGVTIHGVQVVTQAKKDAALGGGQIAAMIRQGSTNYQHTTPQGINDTAAFKRFIYETDPTDSAWTPTNFNANEFGVKKTG